MLDPSGAMLSDSNWTFTINQIIEALKTNKIAMVSKPTAKQRIKVWEISTQRDKHEPYQNMIGSTQSLPPKAAEQVTVFSGLQI